MTHVIVEPGVCNLTADIRADSESYGQVTITVDTKCKMISSMIEGIEQPVDAFELLGLSGGEPLLEAARRGTKIHAACPTIAGIAKAVEAEAQMALPRDASIKFVED